MKLSEKREAVELRIKGWSLNSISRKLNVSKSTVSLWVRDIKLSDKQKNKLKTNSYTTESIEKRRLSRLKNEENKRCDLINKAYKEINDIDREILFFIGLALYWAEGSKSKHKRNVEFSNSDPKMITLMMKFFRDFCNIPAEKFRGHVYLHPHLDREKAELYWSKVSGIPKNQFFKTTQAHNKASKNKKDNLPYGTFSINIGSVKLFLKIHGWTKAVSDKLLK